MVQCAVNSSVLKDLPEFYVGLFDTAIEFSLSDFLLICGNPPIYTCIQAQVKTEMDLEFHAETNQLNDTVGALRQQRDFDPDRNDTSSAGAFCSAEVLNLTNYKYYSGRYDSFPGKHPTCRCRHQAYSYSGFLRPGVYILSRSTPESLTARLIGYMARSRRADRKPTRGTLIIGFPTQALQIRAVQKGIVIVSKLYGVRLYDKASNVTNGDTPRAHAASKQDAGNAQAPTTHGHVEIRRYPA
jgi:hypothetical protein